jgi:hypothetical protein
MSDFTSYSRVLNAGLVILAFTSSFAASKAAEASSAIIELLRKSGKAAGR